MVKTPYDEPANSSVVSGEIVEGWCAHIRFNLEGGANYLLATDTRTALVAPLRDLALYQRLAHTIAYIYTCTGSTGI